MIGTGRRTRCRAHRSLRSRLSAASERDVVVEVVDRHTAARRGGAGGARVVAETAAGIAFVIAALCRRPAGAAAGAIEHRQLAAKALQYDLGRVTLLAAIVGPFAGLQCALDIDLGALAQIL